MTLGSNLNGLSRSYLEYFRVFRIYCWHWSHLYQVNSLYDYCLNSLEMKFTTNQNPQGAFPGYDLNPIFLVFFHYSHDKFWYSFVLTDFFLLSYSTEPPICSKVLFFQLLNIDTLSNGYYLKRTPKQAHCFF